MALLGFVSPVAAQHRRPGASDDRYDHLFRKYSKRFFGVGYDWHVFKAQAIAESNLDPAAKSKVGARGLMQLMPSTFAEVQTKNAELASLDDPEWNIAAGIYYNRMLWRLWDDHPTPEDRRDFMLGSYNAGRSTLIRAQFAARAKTLDHRCWDSIVQVAPQVRGWRYRETLGYVSKIRANLAMLTGVPVETTPIPLKPDDAGD